MILSASRSRDIKYWICFRFSHPGAIMRLIARGGISLVAIAAATGESCHCPWIMRLGKHWDVPERTLPLDHATRWRQAQGEHARNRASVSRQSLFVPPTQSHDPGGKVASIRGQSHEPGTHQMAVFRAFESHDPRTVTSSYTDLRPATGGFHTPLHPSCGRTRAAGRSPHLPIGRQGSG
jgi:hypothetical protein